MKQKQSKSIYKLLIFSLVLLFNPNINIIDIMPDFIAWFILARIFERAADSASYFEEARSAFLKLGWVNLIKIPALILIIIIKGKNTLDNDIFALASFTFGVIEAILTVTAAKYIFEALFHLGERTNAKSFISSINAPVFKKRKLSADNVKEYTYFFFIRKSLLSFLPSMFILTKISESGHFVAASKYYPIALIGAQIMGLYIGAVWLLRTVKYAKAAHNEGEFSNALNALATEESIERFEAKLTYRKLNFSLTLLCVSSFFTIELVFDNFDGINILPHFIYGLFFLVVILSFYKHTKIHPLSYISPILFIIFSTVSYIISVSFLKAYDYHDLLENSDAKQKYILLLVFSAIEFICFGFMLLSSALTFKKFILKNTGCDTDSNRYSISEKAYHFELIKKLYVMIGLGIFSALAKCVNVFLKYNVKMLLSDADGMFEPTIEASPLPWFNIVVTATSIIFIGYTIYITSLLKEEIKMKYSLC